MKIKIICMCVFLLLLFTVSCAAESTEELYNEQLEASGAENLLDELPQETRELLDKLGVTDLSENGPSDLTADEILPLLWEMAASSASGPIGAGAVVLGVILLCALMEGLKHTADGSQNTLFGTVSVLACCGAVVTPLIGCVERVLDASESTSVLMTSFVPVYAGVLATSGQATAAFSFQSVLFLATELISYLVGNVILPLLIVSFALGLTGAVSDGLRLDTVSGFVQKNTTWILTALMTFFIGFLSMQNLTAGAADTLGGRMLRFSVASFVPVVGGALGEAVGTVRGCLGLLKGTLGAFGILANALIVLPVLFECIWWLLVFGVGQMAADAFGIGAVSRILKVGSSLVKTLIAVLACFSLFMILAITIVSKVSV